MQKTLCLLVPLAALLVFSLPLGSSAEDVDALIEFRSSVRGLDFSSWTISDRTSYCSWQGITCDSSNRVISISFSESGVNTGILPPSMANLTHLESLELSNVRFVNDLPPEIWQLPRLRRIVFDRAAFRVIFPATISQSITNVTLTRANISGPLPNSFNWTGMTDFRAPQTKMRCPLPAGLIQRLEDPVNPFERCSFAGNFLYLDDSQRLCGQVPLTKIKCLVLPLLEADPWRPLNDSPPGVRFRADYGNLTLEFTKDTMFLFGAFMRGGSREVYRHEYMAMQSQALAHSRGSEIRPVKQYLPFSGFTSIGYVNPSLIYANGTLLNGAFNVSWLFEFGRDRGLEGESVKIALLVNNVNYTWEDYLPTDKALVSLKVAYRTAHSLQPGGMPLCNRTLISVSCASPAGSTFDILPRISNGDVVARAVSDTIDLSFSYSTVGYSDSEGLSFDNTIVDFAMLFQSLGSLDDVLSYKYYNRSSELPVGTNDQQAILGAFAVYVPIFNNTLYYDPDVSLRLLFSIEDPPTPSGSAASTPEGQLLSTAMAGGVIAAIVIACVVGLAGITAGAYFVFPYLKARQAKGEALTDAEAFGEDGNTTGKHSSKDSQSSRWSRATPNSNKK